jgi:hypothetical protein
MFRRAQAWPAGAGGSTGTASGWRRDGTGIARGSRGDRAGIARGSHGDRTGMVSAGGRAPALRMRSSNELACSGCRASEHALIVRLYEKALGRARMVSSTRTASSHRPHAEHTVMAALYVRSSGRGPRASILSSSCAQGGLSAHQSSALARAGRTWEDRRMGGGGGGRAQAATYLERSLPQAIGFAGEDHGVVRDCVGRDPELPHLLKQRERPLGLVALLQRRQCGVVCDHVRRHTAPAHPIEQLQRALPLMVLLTCRDRRVVCHSRRRDTSVHHLIEKTKSSLVLARPG